MTPPCIPTVLIGLSGSSSSGKTTLAALLAAILPSAKLIMVHADDFCKEFEDLPEYDGVLDADSVNSVDFDGLKACLQHVVAFGELPTSYEVHDFVREDIRKAAERFSPDLVERARKAVQNAGICWVRVRQVVVVDGFLLYHDAMLRSLLDIKLLLRTSRETARLRRFGRYGEGAVPEGSEEFWKTHSYFDKCVWRNYVKEHSFLFPDGSLEKEVDPARLLDNFGVLTSRDVDLDTESTMEWAVQALATQLRRISTASVTSW